MRRLLFALVAAGLMAAVAPATVLAKHHRHARHHAPAHHARLRRFGDQTNSGSTTASSGVGKVTSFDPSTGMLTITLNDNSSATGTVTRDTEMSCASSSSSSGDDDSSSGGDQPDQGDAGDQQSSGADDDQSEDQGSGTTGPTGPTGPGGSCSSSDPTGLTVLFAELRLSSTGKTWQKLLLSS